MRRHVLRCGLLALLAAFSAAPAVAGTIVGQFYFQRDICDPLFDEFCEFDEPFEYFNLTNTVDPAGPLAGLTFSALIQIGGINYDYQFDEIPLASYEATYTLALPPTGPFAAGGRASLVFNGGNVADYFGTLSLSNLLYDDLILDDDDGYSPSFSAAVEYMENGPVAVTEPPSWLVVVIALGALAVGRGFLA